MNHEDIMHLALKEAEKAWQKAEVPVGAVILDKDGNIISRAYNQTIELADPTAHAEILAMREAAQKIQNYRLLNTILYVTVEPCIMCMGAMIHARISNLVFGAYDSKWGAAGSLYNFSNDSRLNHKIEVIGGICEEACRSMMQNFFRLKRN